VLTLWFLFVKLARPHHGTLGLLGPSGAAVISVLSVGALVWVMRRES
jgi:hypothetical protein